VCGGLLAMLPAPAGPVAAAEPPPGWTFDVQAHLPPNAGETAEFVVTATLTTDAASELTWEFRLLLPDGEEVRYGQGSSSYSAGVRGAHETETLQWQYAEAGPYVGRVVWLDGGREMVVAEASGWLGSPDAPLLRIERVWTDPPTPHVGEPTTVSVSVTNQGQRAGSRPLSVWLWLDAQTVMELGRLAFDGIKPGETRTESFMWQPRTPTEGTRLVVRRSELTEGVALAPYTVLAADAGSSADPEQQEPSDQVPESSGA
jgi:hypothetical protein